MNLKSSVSFIAGALLATSALGQFTANKVRLLSQIPLSAMPTNPSSGAGSTGWVSTGGREYAIVGVRTGTLIVDVTDGTNPQMLNLIRGSDSLWHENTTMNGYGYFVSDQTSTGMQIVDLRNLDSTRNATLVRTYAGNGLSTVHTIQANPVSKTLYLNGSNRGFVFLDATNPETPVEVGRWTTRYVHDCVVANYTEGPWAGREIVFACCGQNGLYILDVTNKATPVVLGSLQYLSQGTYCHSGALTADKRYFLINDEFDENQGSEPDCSTHVVDVSDLAHPVERTVFHNPIQVIDHNSVWQDGFLMLAAYRGGVRVYDPTNPLQIRETGFFDTYPGADAFSYDGDWGLYAFPSGKVVLSDINRGFFLVDPSEAKGWGAPIISARASGPQSGGTDYVTRMKFADGNASRIKGGSSSATYMEANLQTSSASRVTIDFAVTARSLNGNGRVTIRAKNWSTGNFDNLGEGIVGADFQEVVANGVAAGNYIDANGNMLVRAYLNGVSFPLVDVSIDMMRAIVR